MKFPVKDPATNINPVEIVTSPDIPCGIKKLGANQLSPINFSK